MNLSAVFLPEKWYGSVGKVTLPHPKNTLLDTFGIGSIYSLKAKK